MTTAAATFADLLDSATERSRYDTLLRTLQEWRHLIAGRHVLDFGCSWGTSCVALLHTGAASVVGVEPNADRVEKGNAYLAQVVGPGHGILRHEPNTSDLRFDDASFDTVLANAVFEHIPQPRDAYLRELWRVLRVSGHLIINETPNKYSPCEVHTTKLWFNHWLPKRAAFNRAKRRGRFWGDWNKWQSSGWRGVGYYEIVRCLPGAKLIPERSRWRHWLLSAFGLPASLMDPYPCWVFQKHA